MALSRRKALALIGGGTVFAAGSAAGAFLSTRTPTAALAPWGAAGGYAEPRRRALSYALLAPSPHNLQPWMAELLGENSIRLHRDPTRRLPATDPEGRQLTIGMGCFLELLTMAAAEDGYQTTVTLFPAGDGAEAPVADIAFAAGGARDPLFAHVMARRSCKEPFDARAVPRAALATLTAAARAGAPAQATDAAETVQWLRELSLRAWLVEADTPRTHQESVDLMRIGKAEVNANPDGIDLSGPFFETLKLFGQLDRAQLADPTSTASQQGKAIYKTMLTATPAYLWVATGGNSRVDQIEAGRSWLRINLASTGAGLALHPISQALQEFPEMAALRAEIHGGLAAPGETLQMLGRVGYGPMTAETPRWALEHRLRDA